jgi:catechol 2,3-dioxygenase-like lactoylglutathione lyase family enzyme
MDNVLIVVEDIEAAKTFFAALGLELEGQTTVEGPSVDRMVGLEGVRATIGSMRPPSGEGRIELDQFHTPAPVRSGAADAPVNALGIRRIMFEVDDLDAVLERLLRSGGTLVGDVVDYGDAYRLCYVRGPEGIMIALSQRLG